MRDRGLDIFLAALFGIGAITILILAWVQPMSISEKICANIVGLISLLSGVIRIFILGLKPANK